MIELIKKNKEVDIKVTLSTPLGDKPKIYLEGEGDLIHHLIEGVFDIIDKLARMENIGHQSQEWKNRK